MSVPASPNNARPWRRQILGGLALFALAFLLSWISVRLDAPWLRWPAFAVGVIAMYVAIAGMSRLDAARKAKWWKWYYDEYDRNVATVAEWDAESPAVERTGDASATEQRAPRRDA